MLCQDNYFYKANSYRDWFDFDKISAFLCTCLENEKHEYIKELFSYIVNNSGDPKSDTEEACTKFIQKKLKDKEKLSLQQMFIFLKNISLQFPKYKMLELSQLLFDKIDFSNETEINTIKGISNEISKEQQENLFEVIKNNLVNESKKTDDYNGENIQKIQNLLKYFVEKHQLSFEKIAIDNFKNLRLENILFLNKNLKIYCHCKERMRHSHDYDKAKDISKELFHNWVCDNAETEINFFKNNVNYILSLGMHINQFNSFGETVLDHIKEEGKNSWHSIGRQEIRLLNPVRPSQFKDKIEYLKNKGAKSFFRLFREYILEKVYSPLQGALFANRFLKTYCHHSNIKNGNYNNEYYKSHKKKLMAKILGRKAAKISIVDFFNFLFNSCSDIEYFDSIYHCATEYLISNPFLANTTPYNLWGQWFFGLVNRVYFSTEEPEIKTSHEFLKKFLELKLPFNITIQNERQENAFHLLAFRGKYEFIDIILQNCKPMIDADLIKKDKIRSLFNQPMKVNNFNMAESDPLNLARNQFTECQEEKYQKTIDVIQKYLEN